ncbi:MAG: hypothetical protein OEM59_14640, partial [Rhodospirillales bacterium]|nr:hypothetical protein [Rhodospirillales bacterium]
MSDKADLDELARRYLDLWQDQISALAGDPEVAESLSRLAAAAGPGGSAAWAAWPAIMAGLGAGMPGTAGTEEHGAGPGIRGGGRQVERGGKATR